MGTCSSPPARRVPPAGPREGPVGRAESRPAELPWASKASGPAPGVPPACTRSKGWVLSLPCSPACSVPFGAGTAWLGGPAVLPVLLQVHFCAVWEALAAPWLKEAETHGNFNPLWEQPQSPAGRGSACGLPALSCQGHSVTVRRSHPGPFAFSAASCFPARPGAVQHPCHSPCFSEALLPFSPTRFQPPPSYFPPNTPRLPSPEEKHLLAIAKKKKKKGRIPFQAPFKHPNALARLGAPHPHHNLFVLQLPSTQLQRRCVAMKLQRCVGAEIS